MITAYIVVNSESGEIWGQMRDYFVGNFYEKESTAEHITLGLNAKNDTDKWCVRKANVEFTNT